MNPNRSRRDLVVRFHELFDPLWRRQKDAPGGSYMRNQAYTWLAEELGRSQTKAHAQHMSHAELLEAIEFLEARDRSKQLNRWCRRNDRDRRREGIRDHRIEGRGRRRRR